MNEINVTVKEGSVIQGQGKIETCPKCSKVQVLGKREVSAGEIVILLIALVLMFPIAIFYAIALIRKEYEFSCPCGYKWKD